MGWNYWYNWTIVLPAELSAAAILIDFWDKKVNNAAWITICLVVVISINMCGAGAPSAIVLSYFTMIIIYYQACMANASLFSPVSRSSLSQASSY
jgi:amino acid permease